jgi:hypothetical protein
MISISLTVPHAHVVGTGISKKAAKFRKIDRCGICGNWRIVFQCKRFILNNISSGFGNIYIYYYNYPY